MDCKANEEEQQRAKSQNSSAKSFETRSVASSSSRSSSSRSSKSSASLLAVKVRAKAEAVKARSTFVKKETELMMEKAQLKVEEARMEAALATLKQEKEVAAALAEAEILESAAAEVESKADSKEIDIVIPHDSAEKITSDYVECHSKMLSSQQSVPHRETRIGFNLHPDVTCAATHQDTNQQSIHTGGDGAACSNMHPMNQPATQCRPSIHPHRFSTMKVPPPLTPSPWMQQATQSSTHDHATVSEFSIFMARRELVASGMIKFDDLPENYWSWKSTFMNVIQGLKLTCTEELDLLIKWLGPQSSEHVKIIRSVNVNDPVAGLNNAWIRLEECYGSPERIERALLEKLEKFPRISNKDPLKLRQLGDLLRELESAKLEGYLSGLAILDTSRGVNPIVEKLPYGLQEKWMTQGSLYKLKYNVQFPPFSFFADFVCKEAHIRNDPSFTLGSSTGLSTMKSDNLVKTYTNLKGHVSAYKTDITTTLNTSKLDTDRLCPIHKKPHPLKRCRGFRAKTLEERKAFLKESGICFKCCSSTDHRAQDCKIVIQCKECDSNRHVTALHPGPAPWTTRARYRAWRGEKGRGLSKYNFQMHCHLW